jgi:plastocyanin
MSRHVIRSFGILFSLVILLGGATWLLEKSSEKQTEETGSSTNRSVKISIVTNEIKYTSPDGKKVIEAYRWDPGTIVVNEGDDVTLEFYGIKGESHPFLISGYKLQGKVERGKLETVRFRADKTGNFPITCLTHPDIQHNGPMVAHLVVLPQP